MATIVILRYGLPRGGGYFEVRYRLPLLGSRINRPGCDRNDAAAMISMVFRKADVFLTSY